MNRFVIAAMTGCGLLCACTADRTGDPVPPKTLTRSIRIAAAVPSTRTELAPDGYNVLWTPGDRIGIYVKSGDTFTTVNAPLTFEGTEAAANGTFSGEITLAQGASGYTLYAYYPWSEQASDDASAVAFTLGTSQVQAAAGDSSHLGDSDFLVAGAVGSTTGDFPALAFRHAFAVIEVDLTGSGTMAGKQLSEVTLYCTDAATVDSAGNLGEMSNMTGPFTFDLTAASGNNTADYTGGSAQINYCRLGFTEAPVLGSEPVKAYLTVNPADYSRGGGKVYVVVRTSDGYTATYTRPGLVIGAAQMKVITQAVASGTAPQPAVDLSGNGPRANCYIASLAGQEYSFDATVAGNGAISQALAEAVQRYEGRTLSASLSGTAARLLWQSNPHLIDPASVRVEDGKIRFTLTTRPTLLGGNAVIGLYADASSDEALWSWHIWITDADNAALTALAETYVLSADYEADYGSGSVQMMDRNLGAIYKEDGAYARSFRAPLYQWGRKDPFPWGKVVFDAQDVPQTYITYRKPVVSTGAVGQYAGYTGNTYYAVAHPDIFVTTTDGTSYDWYYGAGKGNGPTFRNDELWGNPTGYQVGQKTVKTLFDPCPPGWVMPHPYAFTAFTKTGATATVASGEVRTQGTFVQGWNFLYNGIDATYYPGVGFRYDEFGLFVFTPSGYYWSSSPAPADTFGAWVFGLTEANVYQRISDPRGFGLPVRCMRNLTTP